MSIAPAVLPAGTVKQIERAKETERILSILHQWGVHTLGQLAALPRDDLAARLGVRAIELEAQPSRSVRQQFGLFETALRDPMQLHETLARLVGLLGADRVGTPVLEETHRPDAFRMEPFGWEFGHPELEIDAVRGCVP